MKTQEPFAAFIAPYLADDGMSEKAKSLFDFNGLTALQKGRAGKALDRQYRFSEGVLTLREKLEKEHVTHGLSKRMVTGGGYNRHHFNRLGSYEEQAEYMARLKSKTEYYAQRPDGVCWTVPKIVFDVMACELDAPL
jgi:hypothetical protein